MAGQWSIFTSSNGFVVDMTPPQRVVYTEDTQNLISDPSFEADVSNTTDECIEFTNHVWEIAEHSCARHITGFNTPDGSKGIVIQGSLYQNIDVPETSEYVLEFYTSNYATEHSKLSVTEGFVEINSTRYIILMHQKPDSGNSVWQRQYFRVTLTKGTAAIEFSTANLKASFALDSVSLKRLIHQDYLETGKHAGHLHAFSVFSHNWASIHSAWSFEDMESGIVEYMWAIGTCGFVLQLMWYLSRSIYVF